MTALRSSSPTNPSAWQALREYLVDAYSNQEMRLLLERTLLAEAGSRLPDERVSSQEYAVTLCALIQRHSRIPGPDFWRRLAADRPLRQQEIAKLRTFFYGIVNEPVQPVAPLAAMGRSGRRFTVPWVLTACVVTLIGLVACYCAVTTVQKKVMCRDGTPSPTCSERHSGCCSNHGGLAPLDGE